MNKIDLKFFQINLKSLVLDNGKKLNSIVVWLKFILNSSDFNQIMFMPNKSDLAKLLNVGLGTIQNAYRILEDEGLLISKQCVGTFYVPRGLNADILKFTSKKDKILSVFKDYLLNSNFKAGDELKSVRYFSKKMNISTALVLQVFNQLESLGILENNNGIRIVKSLNFEHSTKGRETLCEKISSDLKTYIADNFKVGDKLSSVIELSKLFNVSAKTIHSAIKILQKDGILRPRSGRYGTVIVKIPNDKVFYQKPETSIFASSSETYIYHYERILNIIRKMIYDNFDLGSKLPSISELSMLLDVNPNTIRKCFDILKDEGIVSSVRGRYGGTFVIELPDLESTQSYQWLAVNTDF